MAEAVEPDNSFDDLARPRRPTRKGKHTADGPKTEKGPADPDPRVRSWKWHGDRRWWRTRLRWQPWTLRPDTARTDDFAPGSTGEQQYLRERKYDPSGLPVLGDRRPYSADGDTTDHVPKSPDEVRFLLYSEAMSSWRALTDARFRLLNLLPAVSIIGIIPLVALSNDDGHLLPAGGVALAALGWSLTHGLHIYEARNDGLYDDLISRARRIEYELGVDTGLMRGRLASPHPRVNHARALRWVFGSVKLAWLVVAVVLGVRLATNIA